MKALRAWSRVCASVAFVVLFVSTPACGSAPAQSASIVPVGRSLEPRSELRELVERYSADRRVLERRYDLAWSPARRARLLELCAQYSRELDALDFEALGGEGRLDHVLLASKLEHERREHERRGRLAEEIAPLAPFAGIVFELHGAWRERANVDPRAAAEGLSELVESLEGARKRIEAQLEGPADAQPSRSAALRATGLVAELREGLREWFEYYDGYDPLFSWWCSKPHAAARDALERYSKLLRERVVGAKAGEDEPIVGDPIGRETLLAHLEFERIAYSPEELIAIAEQEFRWCDERMLAASRALGHGDDWKAALEAVKRLYVEPGAQPRLVRELADEAVAFLEQRELLTIPALAKEVWRMEMMSPARQKVNPFFLGGESVIISFPTDAMEHADKLMSLRANNRHFSRAVVHHELIPGHHLQYFMAARYQPHRREFATPFWMEGWALYWEMRLWDLGFAGGPEDQIGMLFWRMHRCARILFSLRFHLGEWTPEQCIDYLVDRVGHERSSAEGEVRRSFNGDYSPLYQVAYMIGGIQLRALQRELVESGRMSERAFHDAVLQGGDIPIEMVRARLSGARLERGQRPQWRFAD